MWNKIKCFFLRHTFSKFEVGYQALNSDGIAYTTHCDRCDARYRVNLAWGVKPNEFEDKKLLSEFVRKKGFQF